MPEEVLLKFQQIIKDEETLKSLIEQKCPLDLLFIYKGIDCKIDDDLKNEKPFWYDDKKFKLGQKFANEYYAVVNYAEMMTLLILFSFKDNLGPLIFTRRSDTTDTAAKRYLSTALRVLSWYEEDVWDVDSNAYKNIQVVRAYHKHTAKKLSKLSKDELEQKTLLKTILKNSEIKCHSLDKLKNDFPGPCPFWIQDVTKTELPINQTTMSLTLFGFMGLIVLYPEQFGIEGASQEELEGFIHMWRVIGYLLGIKDEYNMCQGSFDVVKLRCKQIVEGLFIPNLSNLSVEWEHMSRCMLEGVSQIIRGGTVTFETSVLFIFRLLGIQHANYRKRLSWKFIIKYYFGRVTLMILMRYRFLRTRFNQFVKMRMRKKAITLINENDNTYTIT